jgi:hypothetical protein
MGYDADNLATAMDTSISFAQTGSDIATVGWKLFRFMEQPPFYRTKIRTRSEKRGHG